MHLALNLAKSEETPLDVVLEFVLPGVHVRFSNIEGQIEQNNDSLHLIYNKLEEAVAASNKRHLQLVEASQLFSNHLSNGSSLVAQAADVFAEERMEGERAEVPQEESSPTPISDDEMPPEARIWRPTRSHASMMALWKE